MCFEIAIDIIRTWFRSRPLATFAAYREKRAGDQKKWSRRHGGSPNDNAPFSFNKTCTICFEEFQEGERIVILECQHGYHKKCIESWFREGSDQCPMCRRSSRHGSTMGFLDAVCEVLMDVTDDDLMAIQ